MKQFIRKNKYLLTVILILLLGIAVRIIALGSNPGGVNSDEAYAGYEA